ncbi:hypothetical protein V202x_09670 [Gimesia aquarii]|uniref:Uncharacterized protein n=1 Tax=Gimesia aquarii TaxID=2527964 RepID=A0A517WQV5_9PLAN|nr:hypothetical protein V202x_09670 [Gimesia aquarii]
MNGIVIGSIKFLTQAYFCLMERHHDRHSIIYQESKRIVCIQISIEQEEISYNTLNSEIERDYFQAVWE